jgi:ribosomal protein L7/L12
MSLYYKLANGNWVHEHALDEAFLISEGKTHFGNEIAFLDWLGSLLNITLLEVKADTDPTLLEEAIASENKILAIKLYIEQNNCRLAEAKNAVEFMLEGRKTKWQSTAKTNSSTR